MKLSLHELRYTTYDLRHTSCPNRRNTPNPAATQNKPPILPKLSTNYDSIMQNKANLPDTQMNVNKVILRDYENETLSKSGKNKPNTNPIKANLLKAKMNVNFYSTKDYENIANCALAENKPNTNPKRTQSNPISKAKLQKCKLELITRIWCYKATVVFTKNNVKRNCFFIKSLEPVIKYCQGRDVDFLQHRALIHIRVAFRKVETKLKAYVSGWPDGLVLRYAAKLNKKHALKRLGMNFALFININEL